MVQIEMNPPKDLVLPPGDTDDSADTDESAEEGDH